MESFRNSELPEGRDVPRVPPDFAVRYRETNDDLDNNLPTGEGGGSSGEGGESEEELQPVKSKTRWRKVATRPDIVAPGYVPSHLRRDGPMKDGSRPYVVTVE